jgi:hypothetical protein
MPEGGACNAVESTIVLLHGFLHNLLRLDFLYVKRAHQAKALSVNLWRLEKIEQIF